MHLHRPYPPIHLATKMSTLQISQLPIHHRSRNQPCEKGDEKEEIFHEYMKPSKSSTPSEHRQQKHHDNQRRRLPLKTQPQRERRPGPITRRSRPNKRHRDVDDSNINDDKQHPLHNCVIVVRTRSPLMYPPPQEKSSIKDQLCHINDENIRLAPTNDALSCVSSLSADESHYYSSDLVSVLHNPPHSHHNRDYPHHHLEVHRIEKEKVGFSSPKLQKNQFYENVSSLRISSSRRGRERQHTRTHSTSSHRYKPTFNSTALLLRRSVSDSAVSLRNRTLSLSQYNSQRQNSHNDNHAHDQSIGGGLSSITSASNVTMQQSSIFINGRVVTGIKRRSRPNDTASFMLKGLKGIVRDDQIHQETIKKNWLKLSKVEHSVSLDSQSENTPLSPASSNRTLNQSYKPVEINGTTRSNGLVNSSVNGIASISDGVTTKGKMKQRAIKDDLKYLVNKFVPAPLKRVRTVLIKKKIYALERRGGYLT